MQLYTNVRFVSPQKERKKHFHIGDRDAVPLFHFRKGDSTRNGDFQPKVD